MSFFPDVPPLPGVPTLLRDVLAPTYIPPTLMSFDGIGFPAAQQVAPWGLYDDDANLVVTADTVVAFAYRQDWSIMDYPQEEGAFQTYNKVNTPYDVRIRFVMGGTEDARAALLNSIAQIAGTLDLYNVYTPEATYPRVNVIHYDYERRSDDGVGLLKVDVWVREIREPETEDNQQQGKAENVKAVSAADTQSLGTVQPQDQAQDPFWDNWPTSDELWAEAEAAGLY